jgi:soluble P-type ATPase
VQYRRLEARTVVLRAYLERAAEAPAHALGITEPATLSNRFNGESRVLQLATCRLNARLLHELGRRYAHTVLGGVGETRPVEALLGILVVAQQGVDLIHLRFRIVIAELNDAFEIIGLE